LNYFQKLKKVSQQEPESRQMGEKVKKSLRLKVMIVIKGPTS